MTVPQKGGLTLPAVVRWVIATLVSMAQARAYGEIRITVQNGQIEFVHESRSHRDRLPQAATDGADQVMRALQAAT